MKKPERTSLRARDPGHRLHAQRMDPEQGGDNGASGDRPRQARKDQQEQPGVQRMQQDVHRVMAPRVEPEQRHVEHVREPRQGMPADEVECRERPAGVGEGQPPRTWGWR